jgi:hypothetical protein
MDMPFRRLFIIYLLTLLLIGLGYLAIMPPFEGIDEPAHYSSMRQIARTGTIPTLGQSHIDQTYENYQGPHPYSYLDPPFDNGLVYSKFFKQPDLVETYRHAYREPSSPGSFRAGQGINWQAQHPPLYYLLMAPIVGVEKYFSFVTQIFVLRLASFLLALAGVGLGLLAIERSVLPQTIKDQARIGFFLYPVILPMFFPEFTRIGNDALCLFWVGALSYLLSLWRRDEENVRLSFAIGVTLCLGLLTKALFLPIAVALTAFLALRLRLDQAMVPASPRRRLSLLSMIYPALLIGGGWYLYRISLGGDLSGGIDSIILAHRGGLIAGLQAHFSLYAFARSLLSTTLTTFWAGTWSLAYLPVSLRLFLLVLPFCIFGSYAFRLKQRQITDFMWLPVWLLLFFCACLFYHILVGLALDGTGQTPGWYLHILMPFTAPALGMGLCSLLQKPRLRPYVIGLLIYAVLFQIMAVWAQFALFTGCATKGNDTHYAFPDHAFCLDQFPVLVNRLSVLGFPVLAAIGFGGGIFCALVLCKYAFCSRRSKVSG